MTLLSQSQYVRKYTDDGIILVRFSYVSNSPEHHFQRVYIWLIDYLYGQVDLNSWKASAIYGCNVKSWSCRPFK